MVNAPVRALSAGLVCSLWNRTLPTGSWWWKSMVLEVNVGGFSPLLFIAADLLPGGAAIVANTAPRVVMALSPLRGRRVHAVEVAAGCMAVTGVAALVPPSSGATDG